MNAHFVDFASQNQRNEHSFKIFFGGVSRQMSFETASAPKNPFPAAVWLRQAAAGKGF
jgi:hypothetical protein